MNKFLVFLVIAALFAGAYVLISKGTLPGKDILSRSQPASAQGQAEKASTDKKIIYIVKNNGEVIQGEYQSFQDNIYKVKANDGNIIIVSKHETADVFFESKNSAEKSPVQSREKPLRPSAPAVKIKTISKGEKVDIDRNLAKGYVTVVDFYADWCGPCRALMPQLEKLIKQHNDVVLRKINIKDWSSPVTNQYGINSIPHVRVYDKNGTMVGSPSGNYSVIAGNIQRARSQ
jgi:thioredoxin 1